MAIEDNFKNAMAAWASGVTIVSTNLDGKMYGLTASSFSSLSLDPPLILVCLANTNRMPSMIQDSEKFAVSILAHGQDEVSNYFARSGREPSAEFDEKAGLWTDNGLPVVKEAAAWLSCEMHELIVHGDHTIAVGRVVETYADESKKPLVYFRRKYRTVTD